MHHVSGGVGNLQLAVLGESGDGDGTGIVRGYGIRICIHVVLVQVAIGGGDITLIDTESVHRTEEDTSAGIIYGNGLDDI